MHGPRNQAVALHQPAFIRPGRADGIKGLHFDYFWNDFAADKSRSIPERSSPWCSPPEGFYSILLFVPAHTTIQGHSHRDDRMATVVSGAGYFGYGDRFDVKSLKKLPAGSVYS
jgi:hypothetical protein